MRHLLFVLLCLTSLSCFSHQFSTANLTMKQVSDNTHEGYLTLSVQDLQQTLSLDPNSDGALTWGEIHSSRSVINSYLNKNFHIESNQESCNIIWSESISLMDSYGETLLKLPLNINCSGPLNLAYTAFFGTTSDHKLLVNWELTQGSVQAIVENPEQKISLKASSQPIWDTFVFYLYQGMIHIWIGLDHVLFIVALLLHFAWNHSRTRQNPVSNTGNNQFKLKPLILLITGFTIAHSITLTLTALDWISVSSKWAEVGIAISVAYSALNVLTHWIKRVMLMTVTFGLLHGLGFAGALSELGLSQSNQLTSILGFNLGVEIGQIVIILLAFPILWLIKKQPTLQKIIIPTIAFAIFVLGLYWVWERML